MKKHAIMLASACAALLGGSAFGIGIRTPDQDTVATAQGDAYVARADGASALYTNPAGLCRLQGSEIDAGGYFWLPDERFSSSAATEKDHKPAIMPQVYFATDAGTTDWRFGLGVFNAFGVGVDWGEGSLRYLVTRADLSVVNIAPTVAYRFNDHLSIGASVDVYYSQATLHRDIFLGAGFPDAQYRIAGEDWSVGATVGLQYKFNEQHSIGLVYRSQADLSLSGVANISFPSMPATSAAATANINLPNIVGGGYAYHPTDAWSLEADVEWTDWNRVNAIRFASPSPIFNGSSIPLNWQNSIALKFGTEYKLNANWALRAGYSFWTNTVPASTFSPLLPDSSLHSFTVGFGYNQPGWGIDFAYQFDHWEDRTVGHSVDSPLVDGTWRTNSNAVAATIKVRF